MQRKITYALLALGILAVVAALLNVAPWHILLVAVLLPLGLCLYFLPGIIASRRHAASTTGIILLNVLLGWTGLGWIAALIWAVSSDSEIEALAKRQTLDRLMSGSYQASASPPPRA